VYDLSEPMCVKTGAKSALGHVADEVALTPGRHRRHVVLAVLAHERLVRLVRVGVEGRVDGDVVLLARPSVPREEAVEGRAGDLALRAGVVGAKVAGMTCRGSRPAALRWPSRSSRR
jgi:hypothetical protein